MKIGIIEFPGTNCERESAAALKRAGMEPVHFRWNRDPKELARMDGFLIAGGFSYEDRSRSGIIAALDPLIPYLIKESEKHKPVLGICNGAQVLVETGMVPGLTGYRVGAALAANRRIRDGKIVGTGFYNSWVTIAAETAPMQSAFTSFLPPGTLMKIPAAHAEGRFVIPEPLLTAMIRNNQTLFRYTDSDGNNDPEFPSNPNGSVYNLAGICNPEGNVLALMPHPERTAAGDPIFASMREYITKMKSGTITLESRKSDAPSCLDSLFCLDNLSRLDEETSITDAADLPGTADLPIYRCPENSREIIVELIITDNEAVSVENALRHRGIPVSIQRRNHWEIRFSSAADSAEKEAAAAAVERTGELYNTNKEFSCSLQPALRSRTILVRDFDGEDTIGEHKTHALRDWFAVSSLAGIRSGVLWTITPDTDDPEAARCLCDAAEETHIFSNPYAKKRYLYAE